MSCGSPMPRGERIAKPAEQATRLAVFFRAPSRTATEVPMSPRNNPRQVVRSFAIAAGFAALTGCADHASAPTGLSLAASRSGLPFTAGLASPAWQATEGRDGGGGREQLESDRGAVAGASAVVLTYLFPSQAQALEAMVNGQANTSPGGVHPAFGRGAAIGRAIGGEIVARARTDGFTNAFTGTIPTGSGLWISNTTPATIAGGQLPGVTPWFLSSANQFRPAPPPAFGSTAFTAALAEIRQISDTRTADQVQSATFWAQNAGTPTTAAYWIHIATDGINEHALSEREATHLYALLSATMFDAQIGCWDAKETYWFIRPWQADPLITVVAAVGKPNHPAYPSGHSCLSASGADVLSTFFPEQRDDLAAKVTQAGLSRMYAGIHYRFDIEAGQALGRSVAAYAIAADASGKSVLTPH